MMFLIGALVTIILFLLKSRYFWKKAAYSGIQSEINMRNQLVKLKREAHQQKKNQNLVNKAIEGDVAAQSILLSDFSQQLDQWGKTNG